ncbi:MAG: tRNA pseudouridine(38-40) synthase TruA [bacterium]
MNYFIICEFDGRGFEGWQSQPNGNTIQDNIEKALSRILGEKIAVTGAGRTDAGVSGFNYPFNFKIEKKIDDRKSFLFSANSLLDRRILLKSISVKNDDFSARFSCKGRMYKYYMYNGQLSPLKRGKSLLWQTSYKLDYEKMDKFIRELKGKHDFSTFCRKKSLIENPMVDLRVSQMQVSGKKITFTFVGDRFLHNMIRFIVGTSVYIGRGKISSSAEELLTSKDVHLAGKLAPADGLIFGKAFY